MRKLLLFLFVLLIISGATYSILGTNGVSPYTLDKESPHISAQSLHVALDNILAEDLSLTTSLFIDQLTEQLLRWADLGLDLDKEQLLKQISQEMNEHSHFQSFALVDNEEVVYSEGSFPVHILKKKLELKALDRKGNTDGRKGYADGEKGDKHNGNVVYSDPYLNNDKQHLLIAVHQDGSTWLVGEIDLSFVQSFVGKMAAVADAGGHLFISGNDVDVDWEAGVQTDKEQGPSAKVSELDWCIFVHSDPPTFQAKSRHYKDGEVMVKFKSKQDAQAWLDRETAYEVEKHFQLYYVIQNGHKSTQEMITELEGEDEIESAEPNYIFQKQALQRSVPNDEFFAHYQWNLTQINAESGWDIEEGAEEVIIAVLDTGIDMDHEDLAGHLLPGRNMFKDTDDVSDEHGHGTHVAGISSAITNNITGIAGMTWNNKILPVKVLDDQGEGSLYEITRGIIWATDQGARVINLSLGDDVSAQMLHEAVRYADERDVVLIAAAGNENVQVPMYPAAYEEVLAVAATDQHEEKAVFSNFGDYMDVTAPGEHIPSTFIDDQYVFMSGTSMAAPHVSGLAGLIRSLRPELTNEEVMHVIRYTADDLGPIGHDPYYGYGQINVLESLQYLEQHEEVDLAIDSEQDDSRVNIEDVQELMDMGGGLARFQQWVQKVLDQML